MRTELFTQFPLGVTRVKATSPVTNVNREYVRAAIAETTSQHDAQNTSKDKVQNLEKEIHSLNDDLKTKNIELKFSRDDKTGIVVLKLIDSNTGDSLKQIPSDVSLKLAEVFGKLQLHFLSSEV